MTLHPSAPAPYGLPASAVSSILAVLKQVPEIERIWLFGSRAKGNFRPGSDSDLCIDAPRLSLQQRLALENRLDDLLSPGRAVARTGGNAHCHMPPAGLPDRSRA